MADKPDGWHFDVKPVNAPGKPLQYGQSVTDACLGWKDSLEVLETLAGAVKERRKHAKAKR